MNCPESFSSNTSAATSGRSAPDTFCFGGLWRWDSLRSPASWRAAPTAPRCYSWCHSQCDSAIIISPVRSYIDYRTRPPVRLGWA
jgi:hypothetical protein